MNTVAIQHEPSLDNTIDQARVADFWSAYCRAAKLSENTPYQAWYFGNSRRLAHELVELVLNGPKRATAGLGFASDALPHTAAVAGGYSVVTEFDGTPRAVIRTTVLERRKFRDVDAAFAWDEGEGDRTLEDWKRGHWRYFSRECESLGRTMSEDIEVCLERFELLHPFEQAMNPIDCGPRIVPAYIPGGLAASCALQTHYYSLHHGFGAIFEAGRLADVGAFLDRYDSSRDGVWLLVDGGRVHGSIVIDAGDRQDAAQLRWFIVSDELRGHQLGQRLMQSAMDFCRTRFATVYLHTFAGLNAARRLYERHGFRLINEHASTEWGPPMLDQHFEWRK
ncbi:MAG TPA: GNAT family N-acetyltransferase [Burkholderiaceae bacterium]|nr:GNAT family N-acetyltransferase [Burkholderiaceae bacterium]